MDDTSVTPGSTAPAQPAAPAASVTPAPVSAARAAADAGDFSAFDKAAVAERKGSPLPDVTQSAVVEAKSGAPVPPAERELSKRQQEANERVRLAVEAATKDLRDENARLKAQSPPAAPRSEPTAPPAASADAPTVPEWKRIASMPDAPKLADFDSVEEHAAAMAFFVNRALSTEAAASAQQRTEHEQLGAAHRARSESFFSKLDAAKAADPEFVTKLTPEVKALKPISGLAPGEPSGPLNVLWEQVYDSPHLDKLLLHFSADPQALRSFEQVPAHLATLPPAQRARAHIIHMAQQLGALEARFSAPSAPAAAPTPSTVSAAPPPVPSVTHKAGTSSDPAATAVARGDFAAFDRAEREKLRQKRSA